MSQPVFFASAVEGLYQRGLEGMLTSTTLKGLKDRGLDLGQPLQAAYASDVWSACLNFTSSAVFPHLGEDEAVEALGVAFLRGYQRTLIGGAVTQMARLVGVERTLRRMTRNSRTTNNMYTSTTESFGPWHLRLDTVLEPDFVGRTVPLRPSGAYFQAGLVRGIFEGLSLPSPHIETVLRDAATHHTSVEVRWGEADEVTAADPRRKTERAPQ